MPVQKGSKIDFLTAKDAYDLRKRCSVTHLRTLYGLIEDVEKKIHVSASTSGYDLIYTVPLYMVDLPMYNPAEMRGELIKHFKRHGFYVRPIEQAHVPRTSFYITWFASDNKPAQGYPAPPLPQPPQGRYTRRR
jgi:hypothetical protein